MINLAIVVPCFNEEEVLPITIRRIEELRSALVLEGLITPHSTITFVDDGSKDSTWSVIEKAAQANATLHGIKLSKNKGHQYALLAGLMTVQGDAVVSVDADLQDDPSVIRNMVVHYQNGAEIVFGIRNDRTSDTVFKRWSAELYYRMLAVMGIDIVFNHADYRLMGRTAIVALEKYGEVNLFLRGIIPQLGFHTERVFYKRAERFAGESKYPVRRMISLAWDGLTSFSATPLRLITLFGLVVSLSSFGFGCWALVQRLFLQGSVPGWASTVIPMYFLGGVQLLSLGVIGEYISKVYFETKRRPRYIIEKIV